MSTVTCRSSMHSRRADWVLGEARLISSPTTMLAKIPPGRNSNSRVFWLNTDTPVTSEGSRSGVNWIRRTEQSMLRASALLSMVLPTPGTSSISRWPSASSTTTAEDTTSGFPSMTVSMLARIRETTRARVWRSAPPVGASTSVPSRLLHVGADLFTLGTGGNLRGVRPRWAGLCGHGLVAPPGARGSGPVPAPCRPGAGPCPTVPHLSPHFPPPGSRRALFALGRAAPTARATASSGSRTRQKWLTVEGSGVWWGKVEQKTA